MQVQVVERVVTEVRVSRIDVPHPRSDCIREVLATDDALVKVIWAVIEAVRGGEDPAFSPEQSRFWDLCNNAEVLYQALLKRAATYRPPDPAVTTEESQSNTRCAVSAGASGWQCPAAPSAAVNRTSVATCPTSCASCSD